MIALVSGSFEDPEEDESCRDRGIQNSQEDQSWDHKAERNLFIDIIPKRAKSWGSHVLVPSEGINDGPNAAEDDNFSNCDNPESLWKVSWVLHLRNEAGKSNLANECVADVEKSTHS